MMNDERPMKDCPGKNIHTYMTAENARISAIFGRLVATGNLQETYMPERPFRRSGLSGQIMKNRRVGFSRSEN